MNRRDALTSVAVTAAAVSLSALADGPAKAVATPPSGIGAHKDIYEAALECLRVGNECLDHCVRSLSTGSTMMAECAGTVRAMLPLC